MTTRFLSLIWATLLVSAVVSADDLTDTPESRPKSDLVIGRVSPESAADLDGWAFLKSRRQTLTAIDPRDLAAEVAKPTCTWRVYLVDLSKLDRWPEAIRQHLPTDPSRCAADEVVAWTRAVNRKLREVQLVAPNAEQLKAAWVHWTNTPFGLHRDTLSTVFTWKIRPALVVTNELTRQPAEAWLRLQRQENERMEVRSVTPSACTQDDLRGAKVALFMLVASEVAELPAEQRELLLGALPERVRAALAPDAKPALVTAGEMLGERQVLAAVAPHGRFLRSALGGTVSVRPTSLAGRPTGSPQVLPIGTARETDGTVVPGVTLTSVQSTGGRLELRELRGLKQLKLLYIGRDQHYASSVADTVGAVLDQGTGWNYSKQSDLDQLLRDRLSGSGVIGISDLTNNLQADGVVAVRLKDVSGKTQYRAAEARRLTADPKAFSKYEPQPPSADERKWPFGPRRWPNGENDPGYREAYRKYKNEHDDWERDKRSYDNELQSMRVDWEQDVVTEYIATADVTVDVLDREGRILSTTEGRGHGRGSETQTSAAQITGWSNKPSSPRVPSDRNEAPGTVIQDALKDAGRQAVLALVARAIFPGDGGTPSKVDLPTPPVTPPPTPTPTPGTGAGTVNTGGGTTSLPTPPSVRQCTVVVVVPEQHLRRRVPDPAVETALNRAFVSAGLKVVDAGRVAALRERAADLAKLQGNLSLCREIQTNYGADIIATGEAFSQEIVEGKTKCAARVELKVLDLSTAELVWADSATGQLDGPTVETAAKMVLEMCAEAQSTKCVQRILAHIQQSDGSRRLQVVLRGLADFAQADAVQAAIEVLPRVKHVEQVDYTEGNLTLEIEVADDATGKPPVRYLAGELSANDKLKAFGIRVKTATGTRIEADAQPATGAEAQ